MIAPHGTKHDVRSFHIYIGIDDLTGKGSIMSGDGSRPSERTVEMIKQLVGFNTVSRESNLGMIEWMRDYLQNLGVKCRLIYDREAKKANLLASIGESEAPGVVLSGHTDVVPVDGQHWDSDPFKPILKDGKIMGRGTCDMKSFIAVCLAKTPEFLKAKLRSPVHFAFSYDEEVGCLGVRKLIAHLAENNIQPAGCIVGEPTDMQVVIAHKGKRAYHCHVHGHEAHSSLTPAGVNAIEFASDLIRYIRRMGKRMQRSEQRQPGFDVPFTTISTTVIKGGMSFDNANTIPRECEFVFEYRYLPGVDPDQIISEVRDYAQLELLPRMRAVAPQSDVRFDLKLSYPGLNTEEEAEIANFVARLARQSGFGRMAFGTEAGLFQQAGIPSVICGPGDIKQAHRPNECVTLEQVAFCERFIEKLIDQMSQGERVARLGRTTAADQHLGAPDTTSGTVA